MINQPKFLPHTLPLYTRSMDLFAYYKYLPIADHLRRILCSMGRRPCTKRHDAQQRLPEILRIRCLAAVPSITPANCELFNMHFVCFTRFRPKKMRPADLTWTSLLGDVVVCVTILPHVSLVCVSPRPSVNTPCDMLEKSFFVLAEINKIVICVKLQYIREHSNVLNVSHSLSHYIMYECRAMIRKKKLRSCCAILYYSCGQHTLRYTITALHSICSNICSECWMLLNAEC